MEDSKSLEEDMTAPSDPIHMLMLLLGYTQLISFNVLLTPNMLPPSPDCDATPHY